MWGVIADGVNRRGLGDTVVGPIPVHLLYAVVPLGEVQIVGSARERDVIRVVITSSAKGLPMVELEPSALSATSTFFIYVRAAIM